MLVSARNQFCIEVSVDTWKSDGMQCMIQRQ